LGPRFTAVFAMTNIAGKKRVSVERDKVRRTTHWDLDYLPSREVEDLYAAPHAHKHPERPPRRTRPRMTNRQLGLLCMAAGLGLLGLAVLAARLLA